MKQIRLFALALGGCAALAFTAQTAPQTPPGSPPQPQGGQQPSEIGVVIGDRPDVPPRLAVPEFIPLSGDAETVRAAKTIGQVLFDDIAFEREFYMIPRDILRTVPQPASADQVALKRWDEVGAEGVVVGTVRRTGDGVVVEARLMHVRSGRMALGKQYSGSLRSIADGGRMYAHTFADEIHKETRALRGVARTKLAFSSDRAGERLKGPTGPREVSNIYIADYDGANEQRITVQRTLEISPVWSPDRRAVAYVSYRDGFPDLYIHHIYELRLERPTKGMPGTRNYLPAWSHDGSRIAFMSANDKEGGNTEIYVINRDGSGLRRITNHPMADSSPTWAPTGNQLAFTSDRTGNPQIFIVNADGTNAQRISTGPGESYCDRPTWSPAPFNEIAYTCRAGGGYQIMIFDLATRTSKPITDGIGSNESPAFAPNGRHLAFVSDRTGRQQIYTIHRDGTGLKQITRQGTNRYPSWSQ